MSLVLHVEASSIEELKTKVGSFFGGWSSVNPGADKPMVDAEPKAKVGRPAKVKTEDAPAPVVEQQTIPASSIVDPFAEAPTAPTITFDQVKEALQKCSVLRTGESGNAGLNRVGEIVKQFGVDKVKALKPEQYAAVLEAAAKA